MSDDGKCAIVREVYERLRAFALDSRIKEPVGTNIALSTSFLVEKEKEREFYRTVGELDQKYGNRLKFNYSIGPVPPFNSVSLRLEWR